MAPSGSKTGLSCTLTGRSAVVILDSRVVADGGGGSASGAGVSVPRGARRDLLAKGTPDTAAVADAKEKLRLLTLQTLKYSTLWLIVRASVSLPSFTVVRTAH